MKVIAICKYIQNIKHLKTNLLTTLWAIYGLSVNMRSLLLVQMEKTLTPATADKFTQIIKNWRKTQVLTVLEAYQELSKIKLHAPDSLSIIMEIQLQNHLTEFCNNFNFSNIDDFIKSYYKNPKSD